MVISQLHLAYLDYLENFLKVLENYSLCESLIKSLKNQKAEKRQQQQQQQKQPK